MIDDFGAKTSSVSPEMAQRKASGIVVEVAFCCVARFSAAMSYQSKVVPSLQHFKDAFGLTKIAIFRATTGEATLRKVALVGKGAQSMADRDALMTVVNQDQLEAGTVHKISATSGSSTLVIILQSTQTGVDIMQFDFPANSDPERIAALTAMASAMAVSWRLRQPGIVSAMIHVQTRTRKPQQHTPAVTPILGLENAYGLSRSEFRVCSLLATGLTPKHIAVELGVSIATIRTQLCGIYAKTETTGQIEVLSHIGRHAQPMRLAA